MRSGTSPWLVRAATTTYAPKAMRSRPMMKVIGPLTRRVPGMAFLPGGSHVDRF